MPMLLLPPPRPQRLPPTATQEAGVGPVHEAPAQGPGAGAARERGRAPKLVRGREPLALVVGMRAASAAKHTPRRRT